VTCLYLLGVKIIFRRTKSSEVAGREKADNFVARTEVRY
jgi:hypothetical protein